MSRINEDFVISATIKKQDPQGQPGRDEGSRIEYVACMDAGEWSKLMESLEPRPEDLRQQAEYVLPTVAQAGDDGVVHEGMWSHLCLNTVARVSDFFTQRGADVSVQARPGVVWLPVNLAV